MKFNKVISICKKAQQFEVVNISNINGEVEYQLLGDGIAYYPLYNHPIYSEENLINIADLTAKKADETIFTYRTSNRAINDKVNLYSDCLDTDELCQISPITISVGNQSFIVLFFSDEIDFIDTSYLAPIYDSEYEIYRRSSLRGQNMFCIKHGLTLCALINGEKRLVPESTFEELNKIVNQLRINGEVM